MWRGTKVKVTPSQFHTATHLSNTSLAKVLLAARSSLCELQKLLMILSATKGPCEDKISSFTSTKTTYFNSLSIKNKHKDSAVSYQAVIKPMPFLSLVSGRR